MTGQETESNSAHIVLNQRLDGDVIESLDEWQRSAIDDALQKGKWSHEHPLNIRLSLPFFKSRYYLTIVGGRDKRSPERHAIERGNHPVRTFFNILFAIGIVSGATILMLLFLALYSSIIEF